MKKIVPVVVVIAVLTSVHAQTRRIAHRFHSGGINETPDGWDGNYGEARPTSRVVVKAVLHRLPSGKDTFVTVADTIMVNDWVPLLPLNNYQLLIVPRDIGDFAKTLSKSAHK